MRDRKLLKAQGARLREARRSRFATQREAAEYLRMSEQTYAPYEQGKTSYAHIVQVLARAYFVSAEWLLVGGGPMRKTSQHPIVEKWNAIDPQFQPEAIDFLDYLAQRKPK